MKNQYTHQYHRIGAQDVRCIRNHWRIFITYEGGAYRENNRDATASIWKQKRGESRPRRRFSAHWGLKKTKSYQEVGSVALNTRMTSNSLELNPTRLCSLFVWSTARWLVCQPFRGVGAGDCIFYLMTHSGTSFCSNGKCHEGRR